MAAGLAAWAGDRTACDFYTVLADAKEGGNVAHEIRRIEEVLRVDGKAHAQDYLGASHDFDAGSAAAENNVELVL